MKNNKILYIVIVILALAIIGGGLFFFLNKGTQKENEGGQQTTPSPSASVTDEMMVDCGEAQDPSCFVNRMNKCLPVTAKGTGSDGKTTFEITILGIVDEKCHFQRKINNVLDLDCYFPKGTLNTDTLNQTFGNDEGLEEVVDDACHPVGY